MEYGAGKAGLSSFVGMKLGEIHDAAGDMEKKGKNFLVIDMQALRGKRDFEIKHAGFKTERVTMDMSNFDLVKYLELKYIDKEVKPKVIGVAKHLCGGATDLALTSY